MMNVSVDYEAGLPRFDNWLCYFLASLLQFPHLYNGAKSRAYLLKVEPTL